MSIKIGFIINPIAGMGGKVGLKGTDGVYKEALSRGAKPLSGKRAVICLKEFNLMNESKVSIEWYTCDGKMGKKILDYVNIKHYHNVYSSDKNETTSEDTMRACKEFLNHNIDLILFCGGDGTARDIVHVVNKKIPILGIPSGVKMHSAVFGIDPKASGKMLNEFVNGGLRVGEADIIDLDETLYRKGVWKVRLFTTCKGLIEPTYIQVGKQVFSEISEDDIKDEIAEHIQDEMSNHEDTLYLFGSGGTIEYIAQKLGIENTLLGIDAIFKLRIIAKDLNEKSILNLVNKYPKIKLILSPIGAQGFIIGRGNLQLSPSVIKKIGIDNIIIISTPKKILSTPFLRIDSGDIKLDRLFYEKEMMMVVIGYRLYRVVPFKKK